VKRDEAMPAALFLTRRSATPGAALQSPSTQEKRSSWFVARADQESHGDAGVGSDDLHAKLERVKQT